MAEWRNWAGDQRCTPASIERPGTREELAEIVRRATDRGLRVRASASGHSFTEIALTDGIMVRPERLTRVLEVDRAAGLVKVEAGIVLGELNRRLDDLGLAFENLGDIDRQTLAGSISTGTH
ncbi:MAG: FAD-binding protein, partial [Thermoleophilaceae bacterium]